MRKKQNLDIFNLQNNDVNNKIDIMYPIIKKDKNFVLYDKDNLYPNLLLDLYNTSAIHKSIIKSKIEQTYGKGLDTKNKEVKEYLNKNKEMLIAVITDYILFGGISIEILKNKDNKTYTYNHVDFSCIRVDKELKNNKPTIAYFSSNWKDWKKFDFKVENEYDILDEDNYENDKTLFYLSSYQPNNLFYPQPDYSSALNDIRTDALISEYFLSNLENGMRPGKLVLIPNGRSYSDEQKEEIVHNLRKENVGVKMTSAMMTAFYDGESKPEIIDITNSDNNDAFITLVNTVQQTILTAHRITNASLLGIQTSGKLGNTEEIINSQNLYFNTVISNYQNIILDVYNKLLTLNGYNVEDLHFIQNQPIDFKYSEAVIKEIKTKDEMRADIGLEALDKRKRRNKSIAEIVGGVGIQNIIQIVTNTALNTNQKINMLVLFYDLDLEDAKYICEDLNLELIDKIEEIKNNL